MQPLTKKNDTCRISIHGQPTRSGHENLTKIDNLIRSSYREAAGWGAFSILCSWPLSYFSSSALQGYQNLTDPLQGKSIGSIYKKATDDCVGQKSIEICLPHHMNEQIENYAAGNAAITATSGLGAVITTVAILTAFKAVTRKISESHKLKNEAEILKTGIEAAEKANKPSRLTKKTKEITQWDDGDIPLEDLEEFREFAGIFPAISANLPKPRAF